MEEGRKVEGGGEGLHQAQIPVHSASKVVEKNPEAGEAGGQRREDPRIIIAVAQIIGIAQVDRGPEIEGKNLSISQNMY